MIAEDKLKEHRNNADNRLRELVTQGQELERSIRSLDEHRQLLVAQHGQLVQQIIETQAALTSFNIVLGVDGGETKPAARLPVDDKTTRGAKERREVAK